MALGLLLAESKNIREKIEIEIQWSVVVCSHILHIHELLVPVYTIQSLNEK